MGTQQTIENIKETFIPGFKGVIKISNIYNTAWKHKVTRYSIIISTLIPIISLISGIDLFLLISEVKNLMIGFLPTVLGFTLAGYALVVGFVQSNMLDKISEPTKDSKFSLYQKMSATFAVNVILQGIALIVAFLFHFIIYFNTYNKLKIKLPTYLTEIVNIFASAIISFWFVISLLLIVQIVLNIFGFSQLHHYMINMSKVNAQNKEPNNEL